IALGAVIARAAAAAGADAVYVSRPVADAAPALIAALQAGGLAVDVVQTPHGARDQPIGVTLAFRAIAETGSVLLDERHIQDRAPSLMTIHSLVIIRVADLLPTLDQ